MATSVLVLPSAEAPHVVVSQRSAAEATGSSALYRQTAGRLPRSRHCRGCVHPLSDGG